MIPILLYLYEPKYEYQTDGENITSQDGTQDVIWWKTVKKNTMYRDSILRRNSTIGRTRVQKLSFNATNMKMSKVGNSNMLMMK